MPIPVTVIDHDPRQLGREAARLLFARLSKEGGRGPALTIEMPVTLLVE